MLSIRQLRIKVEKVGGGNQEYHRRNVGGKVSYAIPGIPEIFAWRAL